MPKKTTELLSSLVREVSQESGFTVTRFSLSGEPHAAAIVHAVVEAYPRYDGDLAALAGKKVTIVEVGESMLGASSIYAHEATIFVTADGRVASKPKGARSKGFILSPSRVLDILPGFGRIPEAQAKVDAIRATFPVVVPLTQERLDAVTAKTDDDGNSPDVSLAVFGTYRSPDGETSASIWLITEYDPEDDIADGVLLVREGVGFSEHGSAYGRDLLRKGGEFVLPRPISFREAVALTSVDFDEALASVLPGVLVSA